MAVSHDATATQTSTSSATITIALTIAAARDRYLIVHVATRDGAAAVDDITSVTWNGSENLAELWDVAGGGGLGRFWAYGLKSPTAGSFNAVVTFAGSNQQNIGIASSYNGVDQTAPTGTARTNSATSGNTLFTSTDDGKPGGRVVGMGARCNTATPSSIAPVNGIPEWIAAGALSTATAQTSRTPAAPAGALRGDLEIAYCSSENNAVHSVSGSGWLPLGTQTDSGASWTVSYWYRIRDANNVDPVISWTGSADATARRYLFRDTKASGTPCAAHGTAGTGTASPHTSTGANTTEDDVLAIYLDNCNANTAMAAETNWTERVDSGSATGPIRSYLADREMATSGSATGNVSETGGAAAWVQQQFEIYNAANGDQASRGDADSLGDFLSANVSDELVDTYNTLGWDGTGGTTTEFCAGAIPLHPSKSAPPFSRPPRFMRRAA